jgi:hydroxypyruvate reductase
VLRIGPKTYSFEQIDRVFVTGAGKAGAPMSAALTETLGARITGGVVNVKYGHTSTEAEWRVCFGGHEEASNSMPHPGPSGQSRVALVEAGHPVPDEAGLAGAKRIAALVQGLTPHDLVIAVISGGGSALLPLPVEGESLDDYRALTDLLLRCGADIREINAVRKHCSQLQGGGLARLAAPIAALILSDVVGSPLDVIASGPTVPDCSTFSDALAVLDRYEIAVMSRPASWTTSGRRRGAIPTRQAGRPLLTALPTSLSGITNGRGGRRSLSAAPGLPQPPADDLFCRGARDRQGRCRAGARIAWANQTRSRQPCLVLGAKRR